MKAGMARRLAVATILCAVIGGAVVWLKWPRYSLSDIFEHDYRLTGTELAIEPITIDLTEYGTAGAECAGNADISWYSGPHCTIRIDTIRRNSNDLYEIYFTVENRLQQGIFCMAPERNYYDAAGGLQRELVGRPEVKIGDGWYPCSWIALGPYPPGETALYGMVIDYTDDWDHIRAKQAETGQVTVRLAGFVENHWERVEP